MSKSVHEIDYAKDYDKWKKKYTKKKNKIKFCKKQPKVPEWQVEKNYINKLVKRYHEINVSEVVKFSDFPLSKNTLKGLLEAQYRTPTEIQKQTIGLALQGKDILGAAKTGSGKTLAFVVPVLECLYRQQWTAEEGLAVLIISPTRELAYQTFEVLRKVGKNHEFSAGLIIGGKDLKFEAERITRTNIIICTPGRLLQHMDETSYFYASNLQMLVLDEADRILDMGFAETMNAIIENLPKERQTLLFSATQTTSVKDLARLSLKDPEYVWVHEKAKFSTPATLEQNYIVCELHQKINMLFSFMKTHLKKKSIFFFASCKEVQFLFRVFCRLRPGIPVLALHGKQQQMKRMEVYNDFVRKKSAVLFATDIAARGLDFPAVNWVLQLDCPEDANTYIHRVGRTARYKEGGEALLVLLPSEEKGMVRQLEERKVPIKKIQINPEKILNVQRKLVAFLAQEQELKERAQRCFVSYLRSVFLMKNKEVFDVQKLPFTEYALSLGLAVAPRIRFLQKAWLHQRRPSLGGKDDRGAQNVPTTNEDGDASLGLYDELEEFKAQLKSQKAFTSSDTKETNVNTDREKQSGGSSGDDDIKAETPSDENLGNPKKDASKAVHFFGCENDNDQEEDDRDLDLLTLKRRNVFALEDGVSSEKKTIEVGPKKHVQVSKVKEAKKALKKKFKLNTKITFTEEGEMHQQWPPVQKTVVEYDSDESDTCGIIVEKAREKLKEEDRFDKEEYRKKIKAKHREKRLKEKAARRKLRKRKDSDEDEKVVFLKQSGSEDEFDPDTLPDPNKYKDSDQEGDKSSQEEKSLVHEKAQRKRVYSLSSDNQEGENPQKRKKKIKPRKVQEFTPLDTGLSLAEDEELAIRLLMR